ncbi:glycosyltransferase [Zooshikella marina]|uniref:glycosyltransferase family 2 protein n=1 Tax=Zooshikella ganghwensis TaxID=202772 RepID=UPI001BAE82C6|nr:glycosyltransferase [Zooshikella ganghwensis]MBU2706632.1 glycosyltransferase [Zooshikella ganghwensis]
MKHRYSIIMPMFNEAEHIQRCLSAMLSAIQNRKECQLTVVDNGSTDNSVQLVQQQGVTVLEKKQLAIGQLRNEGAEDAKGEWLVFVDADIEVPVDWFKYVDGVIEEGFAQVFAFVDIAPDSAPWYARAWALRVLTRRGQVTSVDTLPGRNLIVSREAFEQVDGFDSTLITGEDKDLIRRLRAQGASALSIPHPKLLHWGYERSFYSWLRKEYWRQSSHSDLIYKYGWPWRLVRFPLIALLHWLFLIVVLLSSLWHSWLIICLLLLFIPGLLLSLRLPSVYLSFVLIMQLTVLYTLRFLVAGVAVVWFWRRPKNSC